MPLSIPNFTGISTVVVMVASFGSSGNRRVKYTTQNHHFHFVWFVGHISLPWCGWKTFCDGIIFMGKRSDTKIKFFRAFPPVQPYLQILYLHAHLLWHVHFSIEIPHGHKILMKKTCSAAPCILCEWNNLNLKLVSATFVQHVFNVTYHNAFQKRRENWNNVHSVDVLW